MLFKPPNLQYSDENPFAQDKLKREYCAEVLTQIFAATQEPFVLAIDSPFGTGKTTFIEMWKRYLKKQAFPCLYFNAWEHDFAGDPLLSFIGELRTAVDLRTLDESSESKVIQHLNTLKMLGANLLKRSVPLGLKLASAGLLDADELTKEAVGAFYEKVAEQAIEEYETEKTTIRGFKDSLSEFVNQLHSGEKDTKDTDGKPLVFFIDELDRCRPTYAIELLEKIKHFFNVNGIVFVLAMDKSQVTSSIRSVYGSDMDVDGYLRRFIDHEYRFPDPSTEDFCNFLFERFRFPEYFQKRQDQKARQHLIRVFSHLAKGCGFSLRVQEQCFSQLGLVMKTIAPNQPLFEIPLAALIVLKNWRKDLYWDLLNGRASGREVVDALSKSLAPQKSIADWLDWHGHVVEAFFVSIEGGKLDAGAARARLKRQHNSLDADQKERADDVMSVLDLMRGWPTDPFSYLSKKMEMLDRFLY